MAEEEGKRRGCAVIALFTPHFQAPGFYQKQGYEVAAYAGRAEALAAFRTRLPDLALIDIGLADDIDGGFALCRELRALSANLPIIFLSARDSDFDIVAGLRLGADDYLTKDVSLPHLIARIAALFRRSDLLAAPQAVDSLVAGGLDDPGARKLRDAGIPPLVHGGRKRFLCRLFGQVEVADQPNQGRHDPAPIGPVDGIDGQRGILVHA